jgi:hypothetical protein
VADAKGIDCASSIFSAVTGSLAGIRVLPGRNQQLFGHQANGEYEFSNADWDFLTALWQNGDGTVCTVDNDFEEDGILVSEENCREVAMFFGNTIWMGMVEGALVTCS